MTEHLEAHESVEARAELLSGEDMWHTRPDAAMGGAVRTLSDGPHGVRLQDASQDHLGIYASSPATAFPTGAALGSSWDPELVEQVGAALGREARALGVDVLLGPGINIKRSPLCGRNFEYLSEDPRHAGVLGSAWVRGLQSQGVGASVKHFAANNQETERLRVSAEVDERTLREIYFPAFERVVKEARPATVMCSYNRINGVFASEDHWLLTAVLRDEWGFDGFVVSDWGAVHDPVASVEAGLDLEMPSSGGKSPAAILEAVAEGRLDQGVIDRAIARMRAVFGRLDHIRATVGEPGDAEAYGASHHALARAAAAAGSVLLTNRGEALPLEAGAGGPIAVIGAFAQEPRFQGGGSSHVNPLSVDVPLEEIRALTTREVGFAAGFDMGGAESASLRDDAVALAAESEVALVFLGLTEEEESEGFDREHMNLPAVQLLLLAAVRAVCDRVVVILSNGGAVLLSEVVANADAVLEMWLGGQASGGAAADMVFGVAEPGGRLAETLPLRLEDTPAFVNWPGDRERVYYGERLYVGYRWYDTTRREVQFPFGHGLGWVPVEISDCEVEVPDARSPHACVHVTLRNGGDRATTAVVQVYVSDIECTVDRPAQELAAFAKVRLDAGESRRVELDLDERSFQFWSATGWSAEAGEFVVRVGRSSRDIVCEETIALNLPLAARTLNDESTVGEWLAHPQGSPMVKAILERMAASGGGGGLADGPGLRMIEQLALARLLDFGGIDGRSQVRAMIASMTP